jgi:hypothetical protein
LKSALADFNLAHYLSLERRYAAWPIVAVESVRGTRRGCCGGVSDPDVVARNVGQTTFPTSAQRPSRRK